MAQQRKKNVLQFPPSVREVGELWEYRKRKTSKIIAALRELDSSVADYEKSIGQRTSGVQRELLLIDLEAAKAAQKALFEVAEQLCEQCPYGMSSFFLPGLSEYLKGRTS